MNTLEHRLASLAETRRYLRVCKSKLTAVISQRERIELGAEVSACVSRLIKLGDDAYGDDPIDVPPKATGEPAPSVPKRGWFIR